MELSAIILARVYSFIDIFELNPQGKVYYPALVRALVDRFGFTKFPQNVEDFDESKGVQFLNGRIGETTVDQVLIYSNGLVLDTRVSTDESRSVLLASLKWAAQELGLGYKDGMLTKLSYLSQVVFESESLLQKLSPALNKIADRTTEVVTGNSGREYKYEVTNVQINFDQLTATRKPFGFTIERRVDSPFSENRYFSAAPLETGDHINLLRQLEADLS